MVLRAAALLALGMLPVARAGLYLKLPMMGLKQSLNVATAFGVLGLPGGIGTKTNPSSFSPSLRYPERVMAILLRLPQKQFICPSLIFLTGSPNFRDVDYFKYTLHYFTESNLDSQIRNGFAYRL